MLLDIYTIYVKENIESHSELQIIQRTIRKNNNKTFPETVKSPAVYIGLVENCSRGDDSQRREEDNLSWKWEIWKNIFELCGV